MIDLKARADANTGTTAIREGFELDLAALEAWMGAHVAGFAGPLSARQFSGGQSNPTFELATPESSYVMRSKPPGELLATAHAIDREYRAMKALERTDVPVPHMHAYCDDDSVIGRAFYIMSKIEGPIIWDLPTDRWSDNERKAIWLAGAKASAALHSVDPKHVLLDTFGKSGGYVARQYKRWSEQYLTKTRDAINNPSLDRLVEWLPDRLPQDEPTSIIHGDLQLSNMILDPGLGGVAAIIDWELSTLGNPISDFAYFCRDYHAPAEAGGFAGRAEALGIPSEQDVIAEWSATTGLQVGDEWMIYVIFNMFRLAAIRQGVAQRIADGTATSATANIAANGAVIMADAAWKLAQDRG